MSLHELLLTKTNMFHGITEEVSADLLLLLDHLHNELLVCGGVLTTQELTTLLQQFLLLFRETCSGILHYDTEDILVVREGKKSIGLALGLPEGRDLLEGLI